MAWAYCAVLEPWWYFAGQLAGFASFLLLCVLLITSRWVLRDSYLLARFLARGGGDVMARWSGVEGPRSTSSLEFTKQLEDSAGFIPSIYLLQGLFLVVLPFLFPLEHFSSYSENLSRQMAGSPQNYVYLPVLTGLLLLGASAGTQIEPSPLRKARSAVMGG